MTDQNLKNKLCPRCRKAHTSHRGFCRSCYYQTHKEQALLSNRQWRAKNKQKIIQYSEEYYEAHRAECLLRAHEAYLKKRDKRLAQMRIYNQAHREYLNTLMKQIDKRDILSGKAKIGHRLRRKRQKQATPPWLTKEQRVSMHRFRLNRPPGMSVDHIVPIQSDIVCGLHVPWNLQYIPIKQNKQKGNGLPGQEHLPRTRRRKSMTQQLLMIRKGD